MLDMLDPGTKSRRLIALAVTIAVCAAMSGAVAWLVARFALGLAGEQLALAVTVVSSAAAVLAGVLGQPLLSAGLMGLMERREPPGPTPEELDRWAALIRVAVLGRRVLGARSQREQMLRRGVLLDLPVSPDLDVRRGRAGRPQVRFDGRSETWTGLREHWSAANGRLVIVGDPGYGKTFAALALVEHISRGNEQVAELFPLAEWHAWSASREEPAIEGWLVDQLTQGYPELTPSAAWALLMQGMLVPVFDGLDEVPEGARAECRDALEAYAGREEPYRPFVVTCRQREYFALAPKWIGADRHVALVGLDRERIGSILRGRFGSSGEWATVIEAVEGGDPQLLALLRSPLRLAAAIEVYESRNPRELLELAARSGAGEELWDLLLGVDPRGFEGAGDDDVRRWLGFIAASLQSHGRQRFWLHELYLYAAPRDRRGFYLLTTGAFGIAASLPLFSTGSAFGITIGALILLGSLLFYRRGRDQPLDHAVRGNPVARHYLKMLPRALLLWLLMGIVAAMLIFPIFFATFLLAGILGEDLVSAGRAVVVLLEIAALCGLFGGGGVAALAMANVGSSYVAEEPPAYLAGRGPDAVVCATRNHGLIAAGFAVALFAIPIALLTSTFAAFAILVAVNTLMVGWFGGLNAWTFHHWTRWRLARAGLLPRRLGRFLEWAADDIGYLRASDAYEFRHKELLDYLARDVEPVGLGNLSWDELAAQRRVSWAEAEADRGDRLRRRHDYEGACAAYLAAVEEAADDAVLQGLIEEDLEKARKEASAVAGQAR
jgi:MFS family permease